MKVKILSNEPGTCPYCNSTNIDYNESSYKDGPYQIYPALCTNCHRVFEEWYKLEFLGLNVGHDCRYQAEDHDEIEY